MLKALYQDILNQLQGAGIDVAELEARQILERRAGINWSDIIATPNKAIDASHIDLIWADVKKRVSGKPLGRIYSEREFYGLNFKLGADTLEPRPDTEVLVDIAIKRFKEQGREPERILDLGTGTGCILISLLKHFPSAQGVGVDISQGALEIAKGNAHLNGVDSRCKWIENDWCDNIQGSFDLIVSNPPYISSDVIPTLSKEVTKYDPILALDGGKDGLQAYKKLFSQISSLLKRGGIALFEIGFDQAKDVMRLAEESSFVDKCVHPDLAGRARVVEISCGDK